MKFIPLSVPNLKGNELEYVLDAVETEWVSTGGAYINRFEEEIAQYLKIEEAVACQSGTAALHLALQLCGVGKGDEVIVPTLTFIAAVNPVRYLDANPIFMDCDDTLNLDLDKLERFCKEECILTQDGLVNLTTKKSIKAIVVVHVFGNMMNMEKLVEICSKYKLKIIEDATEALGSYCEIGKYKGYYAGTIGDFGAFSFNGNKIIISGGGGMLVSPHENLLKKAKYLSTQAKDDELYYTHNEIGYNYRMTNLQAALGVAQLEKLESFIEIKKENYLSYLKELGGVEGLSLLHFNKDIRPNYWFYSLLIDEDKYGLSRDGLLVKLKENNIQTRPIWGLIHEQKPYHQYQAYNIEKAIFYRNCILNIPCSSNLTSKEVSRVIDVLRQLRGN